MRRPLFQRRGHGPQVRRKRRLRLQYPGQGRGRGFVCLRPAPAPHAAHEAPPQPRAPRQGQGDGRFARADGARRGQDPGLAQHAAGEIQPRPREGERRRARSGDAVHGSRPLRRRPHRRGTGGNEGSGGTGGEPHYAGDRRVSGLFYAAADPGRHAGPHP